MKHTIEELESVLSYNPSTGVFQWRKISRGRPLRKGLTAGTNSNGYVVISYQKTFYRAHVLAWAIMTREWPKLDIDHKNGEPSDNRWENLREVTKVENQWNSKISKNNTSGHKNIGWSKQFNRWLVQIKGPDNKKHSRHVVSLDEAVKVATELRIQLHGEFVRHS